MASQSDHPNAFGIRIVSMDYYMSPPIPDLDICYSSFQGGLVAEVPVIRIYGSTLAGQKTCLHVHRALPYLYVSCSDVLLRTPQEGYAYTQLVCHAMEKALKLKSSAGSKKQHVHSCSLLRARRFYGYYPTEELFLKIYLYYPHEVARAATLLLGGAVLNKSFQPHEAHFPYLLQLLVDYNLYGMGLIHLSKVKFRHPLPAKFVPRAVLHRNQYRNEHEHEHDIEKSSCDSGSFQADSSSEASPSLAVWLSSTIRGDWMWTSPAIIEHDSSPDQGMHHIRRQSTCELEADATVDEILNQQCKMYTSLSQTRSEVKMVQSLVPIWEEEYERTGIHEMVISPDSSKPLPENVLRTFLNGLEFDAAFLDLCMDAQNSFLQVTPHEGENFAKSIRSLTDLDDSSALEKHVSSKNSREISTKFPAEENEIGYASAGGSLSEGLDAKPSDEMGRFHGLSPIVEEMLSTEMTGTSNSKVADVEALGLLRWLASSQAVDDLCTDDELIHEAILSPWLPITTIDKVLEKAHLDYESESQKECQDILDSVEVKEQAPCRVNHRPSAGVSSEHTIPQADGSFDGPFTMQTGNSSETEMNNEVGKSSPHSSLEVSGKGHGKHRQKKRLWGSLPFSTRQKVHGDSEFAPPNSTEAFSDEVRNFTDASSSASSELESRNDASIIDTVPEFSHLKDRKIMAGCSVRDLMRRKRKYQVEPSEFRNHKIRKMVSAMEQNEEIRVSPERYSLQNVKHSVISCELSDVELLASGHVVAIQERNSGAVPCGSVAVSKHSRPRPTSYNACRYGKLPFPSCTGRSLQAGAFPNDHFGFCEGLRDRESSSKLASSDIHSHEPDLLASGLKLKSDGEETSCEGLTCVQVPPPSNLTNAPCDSGSSIKDNNKDKEGHVATEGIEMTFIRQAPIVDWSGWNYGDASVENAGQNHEFLGDVENHGRTLAYNSSFQCFNGRDSDDLPPFFANNYQERREFYYESFRSRENPDFRQENALGIPTHYKNDGSLLYLLTPAFLPPTSQCVHQWLMQLRHQSTTNMSAGILGTSMVNVQEALMEPPSPKYDSSLRVIDGENSCFDNERSLSELSKMHAVSSIDIRNPQGFLGDACCRSHPVLGSSFSSKFDFNKSNQDDNRDSWMDINPDHANKLATESQCNRVNVKEKRCSKNWQESSQISGPDTKSKLTPLSQTGFRDPASIGAGQQLTLLSVEVLAESRGDLRPNPQFDAINVVTLIIQEDSSPNFEVYVLLRVNDVESCQRNLDGVYGCKLVIVSEEKLLFDHFVKIICSLDPDILMGWEIQGSSLGFLAERAAHLGVSLLKTISRTPAFETKVAAGDSNNPGKETANNLPLDAIGESVVLEDAIIKDEWGRTHASGIHVGGRIVLNIWRIMRSEVKLNMYTIETVAEAVLRRKIPSIPCKALAKWFSSGPARARFRCIEYVIGRAKLNLEIMNQLDVINRTSELARVFGIDFFSVLSRGSQYRVESMFLRLAHTQNYLALSPGSQQVASQPAMECLPLVMEPESGFYVDPVIVLDFQSLYPSMIIAYNLCFCTCLGKVMPSKANTLGVSSFSPDPQTLVDLKDQILLTPNGVMYVPPKVRKGVLPRLLEEILSTRIMVKKAMKKLEPSQRVLHRIFNARQLALKLIANVTYGYTAAGFSGRMPCAELADSIVQCGRKTLETAISFVNAHEKWNARVVYGDTDSMFVVLKGRTVEQAFQIGQEIASAITAMNPSPVTLKMEKVYYPCVLLTKKRYVGYSYESPEQTKPSFDAKGIETVRRDTCAAVAKMFEQSLRILFEQQDISKVKEYLHHQWTRILRGKVSLQDFVFAKEVRLGTYRSSLLPPAALVASKAMRTDPRAEPHYGERIPYVVIHGEPGARLVDMVVDPLELLDLNSPYRLNDLYYINKQIIPALQRVFGLMGFDLNQWFLEMPRPVRPTLAKRQPCMSNSRSASELDGDDAHVISRKAPGRKTRIDYYYLSKHCAVCGGLVQGSNHLCNECSKKGPVVAAAMMGRTSKLEKDIQHLNAICGHCGGGDWIVELGVKCTSLACPVFYERRKVQKEFQSLSTVAAEVGFYPRCMVEWF